VSGLQRLMCFAGWVATGAVLTDVGYGVWLAQSGGLLPACANVTTAFVHVLLGGGL
jgi:hypothetical protein